MLMAHIPVIDLFAGPGGLGEGFSGLGRTEGKSHFKIHLSIEKDSFAHKTLEVRSFFRQFPNGVPDEYYAYMRGEINLNDLFNNLKFQREIKQAKMEAWKAELGSEDFPHTEIDRRITSALGGEKNWVLIGGPPCQAYSVVGRSRRKGIKDYQPENDKRTRLYLEYLEIIASHWPAVFVMENVKGLLSSTLFHNRIFEGILKDLSSPAQALQREGRLTKLKVSHDYSIYSLVCRSMFGDADPTDFIVKCEEYGIPQARHRVILLGVRDNLGPILPSVLHKQQPIPVSDVLDGIPPLRSGLSKVDDSSSDWITVLKDSLNLQWIDNSRISGGDKVHSLLVSTLKNISSPPLDRGGEFLSVQPTTKYASRWFLDSRINGICNHSTRGHLVKDLYRYLYAACYAKVHSRSPELDNFPKELLPEHRNVEKALKEGLFSDRFRVQVWDRPSTTVTCHISKDGHYYIHPDPIQCRSLTVREAARLQTFPDNYFFVGPRTSQYTQVGNAVPPLLAKQIAKIVLEIFRKGRIIT
jgi:DNA (cytosine-5)-methyltransferase 1